MVQSKAGVRSNRASALRRLAGVSALALVLGAGLAGQASAQRLQTDVPTLPSGGGGAGTGAGFSDAAYLTSGTYTTSTTDVTIGKIGAGGLAYTRSFLGNGWIDNLTGTLTDNGSSVYTVAIGASAESFTLSGGVYTSNQAQGSTLSFDGSHTYTYTTRDGSVMLFDKNLATTVGTDAKDGLITQATAPNGAVTTFTYQTVSVCSPSVGSCSSAVNAERLLSAADTFGYMLKLEYATDTSPTDVTNAGTWQSISKVTGLNLAVDYCAPSAVHCGTLSVIWPSATYASIGSGAFTTTDTMGRVTRYTYDISGRMIGIRRPTSHSADNVTLTYDPTSGQLATYVDANGTTSYAYVMVMGNPKVTVTDPLNHTHSVISSAATGQMITSVDGLGQSTSYGYDSFGRLTSVTQPEGNFVTLTLDGRGNVTQAVQTPKSGSGLGTITTSASYDATCSNPKTCNQPNTTTDGRGAVTIYSYDSTHGGITAITLAPPTTGAVQPQQFFSYTAFNAYYKNSSGIIAAAPSGIYLLTATSACVTGTAAACAGTATEAAATFAYGSAGVANNLLPTLVTRRPGDSSIISATALAYNNVGDVISVDGPLAGTADTTVYRYDADRELIGIVGPDPDGAGPLHNRATQITYNDDGQPTVIVRGTTTDQTDTAWAAFSGIDALLTDYDSLGRKLKDTLFSTGASQQVTEYGYYADNRLRFTTVRMNPAAFGSLPTPDMLSAAGADGPDRITENIYDAGGYLIQQVTGYGTATPHNEATYTYTNNGQRQTAKDANNNLTTFVYDGFDRLSKVQFPFTTLGTGTSNSADFEQYTYDANGNTLTDRRRDGTTLTTAFDALNRMTTGPRGEIYAYNNFGQPTSVSMTGGSSSVAFTYDALGRKTSDSTYSVPVTYQYDAANRRTQITYPDTFVVSYDYDTVGEMTGIWEGPHVAELVTYSYDDLGRRTSRSNANGTATAYSYDAVSNLSGLTHDLGGTSADVTQTLSYNAAGQMKSITGTNAAYTPAVAMFANGTTNYGVNGLNQMTTAGSTTLSYTTKGELTSTAAGSYGYDAVGNMTSSPGAGLVYDAVGRLQGTSGATVTQFQYEGSNLILEYNATGAILRRYIPGAAADEPVMWYEGSGTSDRRWLAADRQGSIVAVTDGSGTPIVVNQYDEYGVPASGNAGRFQYTAQAWIPEAALYHYKARAYSPTLGRFLQPDPIGYGDGLNFYSYVHGDPVNGWDPLGLSTTCLVTTTYHDVQVIHHDGEPDEIVGTTPSHSFECNSNGLPDGAIQETGGGGGGGGSGNGNANAPLICRLTLTFSAVGPKQATGNGALFSKYSKYSILGGGMGTVAVPRGFLGLSKSQFRQFGNSITIVPTDGGLIHNSGGPSSPSFTVSDIGDANIQGTRVDVYRWDTQSNALGFGKKDFPAVITVPAAANGKCP